MKIYKSRKLQNTNTLCPRCQVETVVGVAIAYDDRGNVCTGFGKPSLTHQTLKLIEVFKCPKCGHSEDDKF